MGYLQDADRWLDAVFAEMEGKRTTYGEVKKAIREKLLESYKNGLTAPERPSRPKGGDSHPVRPRTR